MSSETHESKPILPGVAWLGYGVNMISPSDPFNVEEILKSTERYQWVKPDWKSETEGTVPESDTVYRIPGNMRAELSGVKTDYHELKVETGSDLSRKFSGSASMSGSYLGVKASAAAEYSYDTTIKTDDFYAIYSMDQKVYSASLMPGKPRFSNIDPTLVAAIEKLPHWQPEKEDVREKWRNFFSTFGTHIVNEVQYGHRYQLRITSSDTSSLTKERWKASVETEFTGIMEAKGEAASESELKQYRKHREISGFIHGGAPGASASLAKDPKNADKYDEWAKTLDSGRSPNVANITVKSLYNLLQESDEDAHIQASQRIKEPLEFVLSLVRVQFRLEAWRWTPRWNGNTSLWDGYWSASPAFSKIAFGVKHFANSNFGTEFTVVSQDYPIRRPRKTFKEGYTTFEVETAQGGSGPIWMVFEIETPRDEVQIRIFAEGDSPQSTLTKDNVWLASKSTKTVFSLIPTPIAGTKWIGTSPPLNSIKQAGKWKMQFDSYAANSNISSNRILADNMDSYPVPQVNSLFPEVKEAIKEMQA